MKYTLERSNLVLKTQARDGQALLRAEGDGMGMQPELASRVFDLFAQAERPLDRYASGLGLARVKNLVELHGGTGGCASDGPDKGSRLCR